jgi:UDP-N-acetylglucosamine 2-epimerase (non-hydrolysing)
MKKFVSVLGTRPEIVKFSPLLPLLDRQCDHTLVHTGQHYDDKMDRIFFRELRLKAPQYNLNVGSGAQGAQTASMLERLEPILIKKKPDCVLVLGDTNSTLAGALVAAKLCIPVAHIEAGCRSFNRKMPEEINRILVDHSSDLLFAPDKQAVGFLRDEGIASKKVFNVGNSGLDAARRVLTLISDRQLKKFRVKREGYVLATIHRAENTNDLSKLRELIGAINHISTQVTVLFPIHPRTLGILKRAKISLNPGVRVLDPLGNLDFIALLKNCLFVLSDSGGIQEEAAVANRPCLILREETEWVRLVEAGKNFLIGRKAKNIVKLASSLLSSTALRERIRRRKAPLNFGAAQRILKILRAA